MKKYIIVIPMLAFIACGAAGDANPCGRDGNSWPHIATFKMDGKFGRFYSDLPIKSTGGDGITGAGCLTVRAHVNGGEADTWVMIETSEMTIVVEAVDIVR